MDARHEEIRELVPSYVLGAVPAEEEATVRSHLQTCAECRAEAESFGSVTSSLALAVDPVALPEGFVDRTMAKVSEGRPQTAPAPAPSRRRSPAWIFSAAALVLIVAVGAWLALGSGGGAPSPDEVASLLDRPGVELSGRNAEGIVAKVVETDDGTKFVARGLDPAPKGKIYQLWKMTESCAPNRTGPCTLRSAGTFEVDDGVVVADFEGGLASPYDHAAVTIEEVLQKEPTTEPVLSSF